MARWQSTLASGIDVGQGINVGPGKFGKENKRRALNTHVLSGNALARMQRVQEPADL